MKRIKTILTFLLLLTTIVTNAQIKVHSDNHISIGSLTKQYGIQVYPVGYTCFEVNYNNTSYVTMTKVSNQWMRSWIVDNTVLYPHHRFYVDGSGCVYRVSEYAISDEHRQNVVGNIENPTETLEQINGFYYTFINDSIDGNSKDDNVYIGFSAQEIEKVLPQAVTTNEEGLMYLNYEALTVFLVEAVKEQQKEIMNLRAILEKNSLLK